MMTRGKIIAAAILALALGAAYAFIARRAPAFPDFSLADQNGKRHSLYEFADAKAVVVIGYGNSCPIIQKYARRINELKAQYEARGVKFLMVNPNTEDDAGSVKTEAGDYGFEVPILLDPAQIVTQKLGMKRTSETVIFEPGSWRIVYRGAIDDRLDYGVDKKKARHPYLADALDAFLEGKAPVNHEEAVKGCAYSFWLEKASGFDKDIAPLLAKNCVSCHSELNGYEAVRAQSEAILKTMYMNTMPKEPHEFTAEEKHKLVSWLQAGAPRE